MRRRNLQHPCSQSRLQAARRLCHLVDPGPRNINNTFISQLAHINQWHWANGWSLLLLDSTPIADQQQVPRGRSNWSSGVAAIKSRLISRPVPVQSAQVQQRQRRLGFSHSSSLGLLRWVSYYTFVAHFNCTFHTC